MKRVYLYEQYFNEENLFSKWASYNSDYHVWKKLKHDSFKKNKFDNIRIEIYYLT